MVRVKYCCMWNIIVQITKTIMSEKSFYKSNYPCVIITGASRGFGRTLSKKFSEIYLHQYPLNKDKNDNHIRFILVARNENDLKTLEDELKLIDSRCLTTIIVADLEQKKSLVVFEDHFRKIVSNFQYGHYILIHNAGSIGDSSLLCNKVTVDDADKRDRYYRLNLYATMELTGAFFRQIPQKCIKHIINISSLAALEPFLGLLDYCVGKAAREAYFRQLAVEFNEQSCLVRILNYAPGPLETEMFKSLQHKEILCKKIQEMVPLKPEVSADKLFEILLKDTFQNGDHLDFYDSI